MPNLATVHLEFICNQLQIPVTGFNCAMLRAGYETFLLMNVDDINSLLGEELAQDEWDILCGVTMLRFTKQGVLTPGNGLPSVEEQEAAKEAAQQAFCLEHPELCAE